MRLATPESSRCFEFRSLRIVVIVHHLKYLAVHVILAVDEKTCKVIFWNDTYVSPIRYIYIMEKKVIHHILWALLSLEMET